MSTITGPFTVAPGSVTTLPQPYVANQESVVIDNLSTYLLQVTIGADLFFQSPLTEARYDITKTSQPVQVLAILTPGDLSTAGELAPTWYAVGETPPGEWPVALSGPAAVAAATAAALLTSGIPSVLILDQLYSGNLTAPQTLAITKYASAEIIIGFNGLTGTVEIDQYTTAGVLVESQLVTEANLTQNNEISIQIPLRGNTMIISGTPAGVGAPTVTVLASNRDVPGISTNNLSTIPTRWAFTGTLAAAQVISLTLTSSGNDLARLSGPCRLTFLVSGGIAGELLIQYNDGSSNINMQIADTSQIDVHTSGTNKIVYADVAMPATDYTIGFVCRTAGTGAINAYLTPLQA